MTKVLYPGSFDPITKGHMNIIEQASSLFDEVIIAVLNNPKKNPLFTEEERKQMISKLYQYRNNIKVISSNGASVDIALLNDCKAIVRGLRSLTDFDYEVMMQQINKDISNNQVNTICLFADKEYQFVSSSMVKEIMSLDKDVSKYVEPLVEQQLLLKRGK